MSEFTRSSDGPKAGRSGRFFRKLFPAAAAVLIAVGICHFVTHPPEFLLSEEQKFETFAEEVFQNELSASTLNLHYMVADPEQYGLGDVPVSLGSSDTASRKQSFAAAENYLTALKSFDYDSLSPKQQLTFDVFSDYLETELSAAGLLLYDEPLGPTLGVQAQLPVLLAEYAFRTKGDIEDYLTLLSQIPDYFSSLLSFEQDKANAGLFMSRESALAVMEQCMEFASDTETNCLLSVFNDKIDSVQNLTVDEKIAYKARNQSVVTGCVLPAYEALAQGLGSLQDTGVNDMGLFYFPDGADYYEYLVRSTVGDKRPVSEIEEAIKTQMVADFSAMQALAARQSGAKNENSSAEAETSPEEETAAGNETDAAADEAAAEDAAAAETNKSAAENTAAAEANESAAKDPSAILEELRGKIVNDFPLLPEVSCEVKYVSSSLQDYLSPAFYLTPTLDDYTDNVIYINPKNGYSGLELYTTLAHEGYPGHLYQSVYFNAQSPDPIRALLDVGGYTEGWATYVELYAYSLWDGDETYAAMSRLNRSFTLGLASLLDIGIHYRGYTPEEVSAFLGQLGFTESTAESLYQSILEAPANYLQYYVGYLNFASLRDSLQQGSANFTLKRFHQAVLETGPVPFSILEEQCAAKLSQG